MIRIIIAEDHNLVRQGLRALLERTGEIEVIAEAMTGQEAVDLTEQLQPDVVVMDLSMPRLDGAQAAERILSFDLPTQVVIVSMHEDTTIVQQLLRRGVKGYLLKDAVSEELLLAVRSAVQGKVYLSPTISESVMSMLLSPPAVEAESMADLLTPREREVLQLVAEGHTNGGVAEILSISIKTVEKHRANLMAKLEVNDLPSLIRTAMKHGLIFGGE
ncbi:MAG: response regulator transcription factor [Ardenticatenaceae bacterium]|nr:response regulator transcription factor [Ardenticatenaceae bacterium]